MNNKFTRLILENQDDRYVYESPYIDVGAEELLHAFFSLMIGMTWHPETIYNAMANYLSAHASNLYDISEHVDNGIPDDEGDL